MKKPDNLTVWRNIKGLLVSQYGAVIGRKGGLVKQTASKGASRRYLAVGVWSPKVRRMDPIAVHRLVAECFISRKRRFCGYTCDHIDNNPKDNSVYNLQAVSQSYNSRKHNKITTNPKIHYHV